MDLYAGRLDSATWTRMCGGGNGEDENTEACVEFTSVPGHTNAVAIRDSKNHGAGELRFTAAEMHAFVRGYVMENNINL
ncbi:DUF397 domain-containing protein [Actinokineospora sp.]|uniref:DUF397 domain-containing protein n=1 Tax=Actinokineospora sp. TaxID=1872133 RepID=UPI004037FEE2